MKEATRAPWPLLPYEVTATKQNRNKAKKKKKLSREASSN